MTRQAEVNSKMRHAIKIARAAASPGALGTCFGDAMRRAKLTGSLHGLRRYAATNMSRQGHSSREMAKWLGWSEKDAEDMASVYVDDEMATEAILE